MRSAGRLQVEPANRSLALSDVQNSERARRLTPPVPLPFPPLPNSSRPGGIAGDSCQSSELGTAGYPPGKVRFFRRVVPRGRWRRVSQRPGDVPSCHGELVPHRALVSGSERAVPERFREDAVALEMPVGWQQRGTSCPDHCGPRRSSTTYGWITPLAVAPMRLLLRAMTGSPAAGGCKFRGVG